MEYPNSTVPNVVAKQSEVLKPKTLPENIISALNDRLGDEYTAHYFYRGAANWCQGVAYTKAAAFFAKEAAAELLVGNYIEFEKNRHVWCRQHSNEVDRIAELRNFYDN